MCLYVYMSRGHHPILHFHQMKPYLKKARYQKFFSYCIMHKTTYFFHLECSVAMLIPL
jgi:hypothetical protein